MKRFVLFLFLSVFTLTVAFASVSLHFFTAKSNSDGVLIEWKTGDEDGVTRFEIERSAGSMENFIFIKSMNAIGNNSFYSYQDNSVSFKMTSSLYYYRLKCVKPDGSSTYSNTISVMYTVSGIKDTWGSIKAIFR